MKKAIGHIISVGLGALAFAAFTAKYGLHDTIIVSACSLGITGLVVLAVWLITSD